MSRKKAIVIPIDDQIKVVFGTSVKAFKLVAAKNPDNVQFMDRLFAEFDVLTVEQLGSLTREDFYLSIDSIIDGVSAAPEIESIPTPIKNILPPKPVPAKPQPPQPPQKKKGDGLWFKSMTGTIVILNDVDGDTTSRGGVEFKQNVIIHPNRAINLGKYDKEQLKKSASLRKVINDGDLVPCTAEEAGTLERRYFEGQTTIPRGFNEVGGSYFESDSQKIQDNADIIDLGSGKKDDVIAMDDVDSITRDDFIRMGSDNSDSSIDDLLKGT